MTEELAVKAIGTSLSIVEALVEKDGLGTSELAEELDLATSTVHDHLDSLAKRGYVVKRDGTCHVSTQFLRLGELARHDMDIYQACRSELTSLAEKTGEYASLVIAEYGEAVILDTERGERAVRVKTYDGIRMKMHTAAPGKAILAHLPEERVDEILGHHGLPQVSSGTITDRSELEDELDRIREQGYALDHEERIEGMRSVAAPVLNRQDVVRGAITVFGPTNRINDDQFQEGLPTLLKQAANVVEITLNYE